MTLGMQANNASISKGMASIIPMCLNLRSGGATQINVAVNRVNTISGQNKDNIDILVQEVSRFKIE